MWRPEDAPALSLLARLRCEGRMRRAEALAQFPGFSAEEMATALATLVRRGCAGVVTRDLWEVTPRGVRVMASLSGHRRKRHQRASGAAEAA